MCVRMNGTKSEQDAGGSKIPKKPPGRNGGRAQKRGRHVPFFF